MVPGVGPELGGGRMAVFGASRRVAELEAENASLRQWVAHLKGTDAITLAAQVSAARGELDRVRAELAAARTEAERARVEAAAERASIVETRETAMLQEVGVYDYRHPLSTAMAYKQRLEDIRGGIRTMVSAGQAVNAAVGWTVNNSRSQGERMVRDLKKLMLRAYNAEADNAVRTLKPHTLDRAVERLSKSRETIARLGRIMSIRVSDEYHNLRVYELELTADYLTKVAEEKERVRAERERQREEDKARREFEAATVALRKEQAHYETAYAKAVANGDDDAADTLKAKLAEIGAAVADVESRAANTRAGYVYVISNIGAFGEHMVKVGMTRRLEPTDRIRELGDASVPFRFDTHALVFSDDAVGLEHRLHQELADRRVNRINTHREFFYATAAEVREVLARVGSPDLLLEFTETAEALEWRASGARPATAPGRVPADAADAADAVGADPGPDPGSAQDGDPGGVEDGAARGSDAAGGLPAADPGGDPIDWFAPPSTRSAGTSPNGIPARTAAEPAESPRSIAPNQPPGPSAAAPHADPAAEEPGPTGPGWYPDPWHAAPLRWWTGTTWTSHTRAWRSMTDNDDQ